MIFVSGAGVYVCKLGIAVASHSRPIRDTIFCWAKRLSYAGFITSTLLLLRLKLYALIIRLADFELLITP